MNNLHTQVCYISVHTLFQSMLIRCYDITLKILSSHHTFFFFQAEDGIRDIGVTGVQTCALPISARGRGREFHWSQSDHSSLGGQPSQRNQALWERVIFSTLVEPFPTKRPSPSMTEIGRASCRERV